ncbi:MAG: hypothetical protein LBR26_01655 [Prevotella sp.]|nr:hypothetical protein [Prevotella sp.]
METNPEDTRSQIHIKEEKYDAVNGTKNGGLLGNEILKYSKKVLFDFEEMRFSVTL